MREKLMVLGTGNAMATRCYNTCFALDGGEDVLLVDAGGGNTILLRMEQAELDFARVRNMVVTHAHCDHVLGAVWVLRKIATMIGAGKYEGCFHIWCHAQLADALQTLARLTLQKKWTDLFGVRIFFHCVEDGQSAQLGSWPVTFFDIHSTKERQFGFSLRLQDGQKLTCLGDEPYHTQCRPFVEGSSWLLCEAFCLYAERERFRPYEKHHSTVRDACCLAQEMHIPHLVLWHTEDNDYAHRKARYTEEGRQFYTGELFVPDDLDVIVLSDGKEEQDFEND